MENGLDIEGGRIGGQGDGDPVVGNRAEVEVAASGEGDPIGDARERAAIDRLLALGEVGAGLGIEHADAERGEVVEGQGVVSEGGGGLAGGIDRPGDFLIAATAGLGGGDLVGEVKGVGAGAGDFGDDAALGEAGVLQDVLVGVDLARRDLDDGGDGVSVQLNGISVGLHRLGGAGVRDGVETVGPRAGEDVGKVAGAIVAHASDGIAAGDPLAAHVDGGDGGGAGVGGALVDPGRGGRGVAGPIVTAVGIGIEGVGHGQTAGMGKRGDAAVGKAIVAGFIFPRGV